MSYDTMDYTCSNGCGHAGPGFESFHLLVGWLGPMSIHSGPEILGVGVSYPWASIQPSLPIFQPTTENLFGTRQKLRCFGS